MGTEDQMKAIYDVSRGIPLQSRSVLFVMADNVDRRGTVRARFTLPRYSLGLKSVTDLSLGLIALLLFSPVMVAIALAIKIGSQGPIFFRQRRRGLNGYVISVWKFRTMHVCEDGQNIAQARFDDERVTRIGRYLRRTSVDELPQLFNVLAGEMSLVGPRPHAIAHDVYYAARVADYDRRLTVKPGITGWAQVHGLGGPTADLELMRRRVMMDLYYVDNYSIWLDLRILISTLFVGFLHANAY